MGATGEHEGGARGALVSRGGNGWRWGPLLLPGFPRAGDGMEKWTVVIGLIWMLRVFPRFLSTRADCGDNPSISTTSTPCLYIQ